jgi:hypothetical protein
MSEPTKETGVIGNVIEAVSETIHGAAEGLRHGTQIVMGTGVAAKEATRDELHKVTQQPTPENPSYVDQAQEKIYGTTTGMKEGAREKLHKVSKEPSQENPSLIDRMKEALIGHKEGSGNREPVMTTTKEESPSMAQRAGDTLTGTKESLRDKVHQMSGASSPSDPSYADRAKETIKGSSRPEESTQSRFQVKEFSKEDPIQEGRRMHAVYDVAKKNTSNPSPGDEAFDQRIQGPREIVHIPRMPPQQEGSTVAGKASNVYEEGESSSGNHAIDHFHHYQV